MAFSKPAPKTAIDPDRERVRFATGLKFEGVIVAISDRKPSNYGGEVRYIDVDRTDGSKISFGLSKFKLEMFEDYGYQTGDGIRVDVTETTTQDGQRTYGDPGFEIDARGPRNDSQAATPVAAVANDSDIPF
jgi:hypothetical protein